MEAFIQNNIQILSFFCLLFSEKMSQIKKRNRKNKKKQPLRLLGSDNDPVEDEEINLKEFMAQNQKKIPTGISAENTLKVVKGGNFEYREELEPQKYVGKRPAPSGEEVDEECEIEKQLKESEKRLKVIQGIEQQSRRIKEERKSKAQWTGGLLPVDISMEKKLEAIEKTEKFKKENLLDEIADSFAARPKVIDTSGENLKHYLWKSRDHKKEKRQAEKRTMQQYLKSFSKTSKKEAKQSWKKYIENEGNRKAFHEHN